MTGTIEKMLSQVSPPISEKKKQELAEILKRLLLGETTYADELGFTPAKIEKIYSQGYHQFQSGNYKAALPLLSLVVLLDKGNRKYVMALGECYMQMKEYSHAIDAYMSAHLADLTDPLPFYRIAECYLKLNDNKYAAFNFGMAYTVAGNNPKYAHVKEISKLNLDSITNIVIEENKAKQKEKKKLKEE